MEDGWDQLDTLRLILASTVALGHAVGIFAQPFGYVSDWINDLFSWASASAVLVFFLISGLAIGRSLTRLRENNDALFPVFMWHRFLRLYPPLLFSVALCVALAIILRSLGLEQHTGAADVVRTSFSYLDNLNDVAIALITFGFRGGLTGSSNGPLWSLALEMQAYVLAGLVVQIWTTRSWWIKIISTFGLLVALRKRGVADLDLYHSSCFALFLLGLFLSRAQPKFPRLLPTIKIDFSYSLYILHFPLMLFVFFLSCQAKPDLLLAWLLVANSLACSFVVAIVSGLTLERARFFFRSTYLTSTPWGFRKKPTAT
jgi:peptidoglycan/LPS O-acetylase OafA/YrhL